MDARNSLGESAAGPLRFSAAKGLLLGRARRLKYTWLVDQLDGLLAIRDLILLANRYLPGRSPDLKRTLTLEGALAFYGAFLEAMRQERVLPICEPYIEELTEISPWIPLDTFGVEYEEIEAFGQAVVVTAAVCLPEPLLRESMHVHVCIPLRIELCPYAGTASGAEDLRWLRGIKADPEWKHLPSLVRWTVKATGTFFLDASPTEYSECWEPPKWEDVDSLIVQSKRAMRTLDRAVEIGHWIESAPAERLTLLAKILEGGYERYERGLVSDPRQLRLWPRAGWAGTRPGTPGAV